MNDLAAFCTERHIPADFLLSLGVRDRQGGGLTIPYYDESGADLLERYRLPEGSRQRFSQPAGVPLQAYGEWRLEDARRAGHLYLVEGESDCWAMWAHSLPALGLPGSNAYDVLRAPHLEGLQEVYISREPGKSGEQFQKGTLARLAALGWAGLTWELAWTTEHKDPCALHQSDPSGFAEALRWKIESATRLTLPKAALNGHHAANGRAVQRYRMDDLMRMDLPPTRWAVTGILPQGLALLAGKPKLGKSFLALNLALTVAAGGKALGNLDVVAGDVLYLCLEDRLRRIQDRARKLLAGLRIEASGRLQIATEWPRQHEGGLDQIAKWMAEVERPALVIIDVWTRFRTPSAARGNAYEEDYVRAGEVKALGDENGCTMLALHHCKKAAAEDVLDEISGTLGLAGCADTPLVLTRSRGENEAVLHVDGRDVDQSQMALSFDPLTCCWTCLGPAGAVTDSRYARAVLDLLRLNAGSILGVKEMGERLSISPDKMAVFRKAVRRLEEQGTIEQAGYGKYRWPVREPE